MTFSGQTPGPFTAGTANVKATSRTALQPGSYLDVTAGGNKTVITLAPGTYYDELPDA